MIGETGNNLINTHIGEQYGGQYGAQTISDKKSVNKYYNVFTKELEEMKLPDIDLEFNAVLIPNKSTVMWTT